MDFPSINVTIPEVLQGLISEAHLAALKAKNDKDKVSNRVQSIYSVLEGQVAVAAALKEHLKKEKAKGKEAGKEAGKVSNGLITKPKKQKQKKA